MLKKFILSNLFILLAISSAFAVQILHPGIKINSTPITEEKYLLTRAELDNFLAQKEDLEAANAIIKLRDIRINAYENALASTTNLVADMSERLINMSQKLVKSAEDKAELISNNNKMQKRQQNRNLLDILAVGLALGRAGGFSIKF